MLIALIVCLLLLVCGLAYLYYRKKTKKEEEMAAGFQSFLSDGSVNYDLTQSSCFIYGYGDTGEGAGAIEDDRIIAGKTFIYPYWAKSFGATSSYHKNSPSIGYSGLNPSFVITNGKITWSYKTSSSNYYMDGYTRYKFVYGGLMK